MTTEQLALLKQVADALAALKLETLKGTAHTEVVNDLLLFAGTVIAWTLLIRIRTWFRYLDFGVDIDDHLEVFKGITVFLVGFAVLIGTVATCAVMNRFVLALTDPNLYVVTYALETLSR